ncbi:hypothetical protein FNV43_RR21482 [Rhamnella rubrinervis]|uniref:Cytochrome P450 n=1 Tax=Rhamnella rubrinervis TaxID=2594499 RepID=A0A8K0GVE4_9ROSA|nr:hypothetical protein FNV43_RR21482 [Rhamnella rubrinervis]
MDPVKTLLKQWYWQELQATTLFNHIMIISSLLLIFFSVLAYKLTSTAAPKLSLPPSPPKLPIIGNIHQLGTQLHRSLRASLTTFQFVREEEVALMVEEIRRCCVQDGADHVVDLGEVLTAISNNIASRSALGRKYEGDEDGNNLNFGDLSKKAMELMGTFSFGDMFPYLRWIDVLTGYNAKVRNTAKAFHALLDQVIDEHQQQSSTEQSDKKDPVDILLQIQKDGQLGINLTRENLKAILLDMFIGGTDTTATTMEWAMAELVKNQETLRLHAPVVVTRESSSSVSSKLKATTFLQNKSYD